MNTRLEYYTICTLLETFELISVSKYSWSTLSRTRSWDLLIARGDPPSTVLDASSPDFANPGVKRCRTKDQGQSQ